MNALKALAHKRHIQTHVSFSREYEKQARKLDPSLAGNAPSSAQLNRWFNGDLKGLPYADHCRVLEGMFLGWTAEQLFQEYPGDLPASVDAPKSMGAVALAEDAALNSSGTADLVEVFVTRSDFMHDYPPQHLFNGAHEIRAVGLSLNIICQQYPDGRLRQSLTNGATVKCLFLDPDGKHVKEREAEEDHEEGVLSSLTSLNIQTLQRVRKKLPAETSGQLLIRVYDEPARFNVTVIDNSVCIVQPYLPHARGLESPTFIVRHQPDRKGLYDTFTQVFDSLWERGKEVEA